MNYEFEEWIKNVLPEGKSFTFNKDAVEVLLRLAFKEGVKHEKKCQADHIRNEEYDKKYGDL